MTVEWREKRNCEGLWNGERRESVSDCGMEREEKVERDELGIHTAILRLTFKSSGFKSARVSWTS